MVIDGDGDDADKSESPPDGPKPLVFPNGSAAQSLFAAATPPELDDAGGEDEPPSFLFFQLPASLPLKAGVTLGGADSVRHGMNGAEYLAALASIGAGKAEAAGDGAGVPPKTEAPPVELRDLGSGLLGELVVRRSGKVQLRIGALSLDVQPGTICSTDQEIVTMAAPSEAGGDVELHRLGKMPERMVVAPNLDHLLGGGCA